MEKIVHNKDIFTNFAEATSQQQPASTPWTQEKEEFLLEPYNYLLAHPGKEIRSKLIDAFDHWLKVPKDKLTIISKVVEMLHTASLLIDDVEDDSKLRRGVPVAHSIYGIPATINCANYVYFLGLNELKKLNDVNMFNIYTEELLRLHRGQGLELYWRDNLICPSEKEFIEMVSNNILKQHTTSIELKQFAVKIMEKSGSFDYTKHYLSKTEKKSRDEIQRLGGNPMLEQLMDFLSTREL
ncbi:10444_t:CDS:2 [Funneliformis mosseae]|uniref:10444_t:CDS:1 n=1 Tax=Funneliformis mosseae TaxID=27381 RepID=A0A9N9BC45_FUNMO|nr:10444_t:CDS:2 [Funneliformis mosseae]